jgi:hypothetical protein
MKEKVQTWHPPYKTLCKSEAIRVMNSYGDARNPFLFLIDYEMEAILLFPLDRC